MGQGYTAIHIIPKAVDWFSLPFRSGGVQVWNPSPQTTLLPSVLRAIAPYLLKNIHFYPSTTRDQDNSVDTATCYRLGGPGIESQCVRDFAHLSRQALGPTQPPIRRVPSLSPGLKRPGRGVDHPPLFNAEVKERVELYIYSPSGPSWPVLGWTLLFHPKPHR